MGDGLSVIAALSAVMADVGAVGKDSRNTHQNFNFRGVDAVVNAVSPALQRHGVVVVPTVLTVERATSPTKGSGTINNVYVTVRYDFHGPAGDSVSAVVAAESFDSGDKATAKAMSVAFRTALLQALCLPTDDPDPDSHTYERAATPPAASLGGRYSGRSHPEVGSDEGRVIASQRRLLESVGGDKAAARALWESVTAELGDPPADIERMEAMVTELSGGPDE